VRRQIPASVADIGNHDHVMLAARPSFAGAVGAAAAFLLPVAYWPSVGAAYWSPKAAALLACGSAGIPALIMLVKSPIQRRAAISALLFLGVASASALLSSRPWMSVLGLYNWGTGLLFLICCAGLWAIGATVLDRDRGLVVAALVAGVLTSSLVALLQAFDAVDVASLQARGRAWGLAGNAVHLGALSAGLVALSVAQARRWPAWCALAFVGSLVAQLSGTRFALVVIVLATILGALRAGPRRGAVVVVAVLAGLGAGSVIAASGGLSSASGRSTAPGTDLVAGGTTQVRVEVWRSALTAFGDEPIIGSGPGRFRAATSAHRSLEEARIEGGDALYVDAHNIVVEHMVTTGALGALALLVWLGLASRRATGHLLWFALALLAMSLVEPMHAGVTPLAFLALGVAGGTEPAGASRWHRQAMMASLAIGILAAVTLLAFDTSLIRAVDRSDEALARRADRLIRPWPEGASVRARLAEAEVRSGERPVDDAIDLWRDAVRRDPSNPVHLVALADAVRYSGDTSLAEELYKRGLEFNPWSTVALQRLASLAEERGDLASAHRWARLALEVEAIPSMEELVARTRSASSEK
jgi:hypothetical protein